MATPQVTTSFLREVLTAHELEELGLHDAIRNVNVAPEKHLNYSGYHQLRRLLLILVSAKALMFLGVVFGMDSQHLLIYTVVVATLITGVEFLGVRTALGSSYKPTSWTLEGCWSSWLHLVTTTLDTAFVLDLWSQQRPIMAATSTIILTVFVFGLHGAVFLYMFSASFRSSTYPSLRSIFNLKLPTQTPIVKRGGDPSRRRVISVGMATLHYFMFTLTLNVRAIVSKLKKVMCLSLSREHFSRSATPEPDDTSSSPQQSLLDTNKVDVRSDTWPIRGAFLACVSPQAARDFVTARFTHSAAAEVELPPLRRSRGLLPTSHELYEDDEDRRRTSLMAGTHQWKRLVVPEPTEEKLVAAFSVVAADAKVPDLQTALLTNLAAISTSFCVHEALREKFVAADLEEYCEFILGLILFVYLHLSSLMLNLIRFHLLMVGGRGLIGLVVSMLNSSNLFVYVAFDRQLLEDILED